MSYCCVGGDMLLGDPGEYKQPPPAHPLEQAAIAHVYQNGPRHFSPLDKHELLHLSDDLLEVFVPDEVPRPIVSRGVSVRTDTPIPRDSGWYYFEVEILERRAAKGCVGVGLSSQGSPLSPGIGAVTGTISYDNDDGVVYDGSKGWGHEQMYGPPFGEGDRIGCLLDASQRSVFYFKNGGPLGEALHDIDLSIPLYPAVTLNSSGWRVRTYLAIAEFRINLQTIHEALHTSKLALYRNPLRLPERLSEFATRGSVSQDGLEILPSEDPNVRTHHGTWGCLMFLSDRPIPVEHRCYYYEILIKSLPFSNKGEVEIGVSTTRGPSAFMRNLAKYESSGTVSILTGNLDLCTAADVPFHDGDVIGCMIDLQRGHIWWTKNGTCHTSPSSLLDKTLPLRPTIWTHGRASVYVNFGQEKFKYDVKAHIATRMDIAASKVVLPAEVIIFVIEWILVFCMQRGATGITFNADMIFWQRTLGAMRLTCRFWGRVLREYLFRNVTILSGPSYNRFVRLLASDGSIGRLVHSVELRDTSTLPWSHRAFLSTTMRKLRGVQHLFLGGSHLVPAEIQRKARPPSLSGPGIYALIGHSFGGIYTLTVNGLAFASFNHIRYLLKGLPRLWRFDGQALVWPQAQTKFLAMKLDVPRLSYVKVAGCVDNLIGTGILLATPYSSSSPAVSRPILDLFTRNAMLDCIRAFTQSWKGVRTLRWILNPRLQKWLLTVSHGEHAYEEISRLGDVIHIACDAASAPASAQFTHILFAITLPTEPSDAELDDIKNIAWRDIDAALSEVKTFQTCLVDFKSATERLFSVEEGHVSVTVPMKWAALYQAIMQDMVELRRQEKFTIRVEFDPARLPEAPPASFWEKVNERPLVHEGENVA